MLEPDTNVIQRKLSNEADKDPLRFTPSKRIFLQENFRKDEIHKKKDVSCLKSNSKILKKKRHKDKIKLFKLDKHIWNPAIQVPVLGKTGKHFKNKDNKDANTGMSGSRIPNRERTNYGEKANPIGAHHHPKPLEYTFDILCLTANDLHPSTMKEQEETIKQLANDFLTMGSHSPAPKADMTNEVFLGDLIDLGTPNVFGSKQYHHYYQLSKPQMDKDGETDEVRDSKSHLSCSNPSLIDSKEPCCLEEDTSLHPQVTSDLRRSGSGELEEQSANVAVIMMLDHNDSVQKKYQYELEDQRNSRYPELSKILHESGSVDERASSPMIFYGFPGLNPSMERIEKRQATLTCHRSRQMLIGHLNRDPFPQVVRENAKVHLRRRAFSMDDTLIACLPNRPIDEIVNPDDTPLEVNSADVIEFGPQCELKGLNEKSSEPVEGIDHSTQLNQIDSTNPSTYQNPKIVVNESDVSLSTNLEGSTSELIANADIENEKGSDSNSNVQPETEKHTVCEDKSNITLSELSDVNISKEDSNSTVLVNSIDSPKISNDCKNQLEKIKEPYRLEQTLDLASDNTLQHEDLLISLKNNFTCSEKLCDEPGEIQPSKSCETYVEVLGSDRTSILQQQISSALEVETKLVSIAMGGGSPSDSRETSEIGLPVDIQMDGSANRDILPQNTVDQTPLLLPSSKKEISDDSEHEAPVFHPTEYELINTSAGEINQNSVSEERKDNIAEEHTTPAGSVTPSSAKFPNPNNDSSYCNQSGMTPLGHWVLPPGKKFRRSLSIIRNLDQNPSAYEQRGRHYEKSVEEIIRLQGNDIEASTPVRSLCKRLSKRRSSWMRQITPPRITRSTFIWSPTITDRGTLYETPPSRKSIYSTPMQQNGACRMSVRTSSMLGPRRSMRSPFKQDCAPASPVQYTIRDLILTICKQSEPCSFSDILSEESHEGGCKIGEGVFGEVFSITRNSEDTVLKIIPIEGQQLVNGEKQKTYQEVLSELVIAKVLNELRYVGSDELNLTSGYAEVIATSLVQDSYPEPLLQYWEKFDRTKGSDNENPRMFDKDQLFVVMEQGNGGKDLESYTFSSAKQSLSIFKQIAFSLAVAEISVEFEHRDLHWGNVLVSKTSEKQIAYTLNGTQYYVASNGVKSTIIDYTLSRIKYINQVPIYNDIGKDPEMFIATGDYQFDIYRLMKQDVEDDWSRFIPKTNARWLHYLLDKLLTKVKYQRRTAKVHKDSFKVLEEINEWVEGSGSALSIALRLAGLKH